MSCYGCEKPLKGPSFDIDGEFHCEACYSEIQTVLGLAVQNGRRINSSGLLAEKTTPAEPHRGVPVSVVHAPKPTNEIVHPSAPSSSSSSTSTPANSSTTSSSPAPTPAFPSASAPAVHTPVTSTSQSNANPTILEEGSGQNTSSDEATSVPVVSALSSASSSSNITTDAPSLAHSASSSSTSSTSSLASSSTLSSTRERELLVGYSSTKGTRKKNEDTHTILLSMDKEPGTAFFAVYDGHGGRKASAYCKDKMHANISKLKVFATDKRKALVKGFIKTDEKYCMKMENDGCTAVVVLLMANNHVFVANAGDSRAIVIKQGKASPLSQDHKPSLEEERRRIEAAGHEVVVDTALVNGKRVHTDRIDGQIAVSRAIGDNDFKDNYQAGPEAQAITCVPDVTEDDVQAGDMLLLACDGLWDVLSNQEVADFITHKKKEGKDLMSISAELSDLALACGSEDNITIVMVEVQ